VAIPKVTVVLESFLHSVRPAHQSKTLPILSESDQFKLWHYCCKSQSKKAMMLFKQLTIGFSLDLGGRFSISSATPFFVSFFFRLSVFICFYLSKLSQFN
jgi:hypothetical protein